MGRTRRTILLSLAASALLPAQQQSPPTFPPVTPSSEPGTEPRDEERMPNGKSRKIALAKEQHEAALKDVNDLIADAQQLKQELQKAGDYVVPFSSVKRTEEIEKLARRIRGRLKQ